MRNLRTVIHFESPLAKTFLALLIAVVACGNSPAAAGTVVRVERADTGYRLTQDGRPYFIRGAGGCNTPFLMEQLVAAGGNSIRIWNAREDSQALFDLAHAHGLTVCPTLWMGRDNRTPATRVEDYSAARVQSLVADARAAVVRFKDHPALIVWGVGNEMEAPGDGTPELWRAVNEVAAMVHRVDTNHPTMTVIADLGKDGGKVRQIKRHCPHIDILGVNTYGGGVTLAKRLAAAGWDKPYVVSEFGPAARQKQTAWGAEIESPTTQRAAPLAAIYQAAIAPRHPDCLGSFVFLWRQSEIYPSFYDCFTPAGERLAPVETMTRAWTGRPPPNRCPEIQPIVCAAAAGEISPGAALAARVSATDADGDPLQLRWEVRAENLAAKSARHACDQLVSSGRAGKSAGAFRVEFSAPPLPGAYRLFVTVADGHGNAAVASLPFHVGAPAGVRAKTP